MEDSSSDVGLWDELLQLLYWLEGEGFGGTATRQGLNRFLDRTEGEIAAALDLLERRGLIGRSAGGDEYRLSEDGRREAARRFAEEFGPLLGQGHGQCSDPDCECHTDPDAALECHQHRGPDR